VPSCSLRDERDTGRIESFERPVQVTDGAREPFDVIENKNEILAERVGFEPTVEFPRHTLSKRAP
jgi:hypothetical protein